MVAREGVQQPAIRERLISPLLRSCGCGLQGRPRERRRHARRPGMHHKEGHTLHLFVGQTGSRVASGVVSQKIPFIPQLQADVPELRVASRLVSRFNFPRNDASRARAAQAHVRRPELAAAARDAPAAAAAPAVAAASAAAAAPAGGRQPESAADISGVISEIAAGELTLTTTGPLACEDGARVGHFYPSPSPTSYS